MGHRVSLCVCVCVCVCWDGGRRVMGHRVSLCVCVCVGMWESTAAPIPKTHHLLGTQNQSEYQLLVTAQHLRVNK